MNITRKLRSVFEALASGRRKGFTSEMKKIADFREDVLVVCPDAKSASRFGEKGVSIFELDNKILNSTEKRLILIDNHTLLALIDEASSELQFQETELNKFSRLVKSIETKLDDFKSTSRYNAEKHHF